VPLLAPNGPVDEVGVEPEATSQPSASNEQVLAFSKSHENDASESPGAWVMCWLCFVSINQVGPVI
jgi:hypothetical protein